MMEQDGWVQFRNLKGAPGLRQFLEDDPWGQDWVAKFFMAGESDESFALPDEESIDDPE